MIPIYWLWCVEFARWTSPTSSGFECHVVAGSPKNAIDLAWKVARADWRDEASHLSVHRATRVNPVHALPEPAPRSPASPGDATKEE